MKISLNWIQDFVQLPELPAFKIAERFTLGCAEVEDVVESGVFWQQLKVAEVVSFEKHPEADKLNLVSFNLGAEGTKQVVCGAGNVRVGMKTVYAPIGVTLPIGLTLEPKKIRGILSEGMLCSEEELGMATTSDGILDLPADAPVGETIQKYWNKASDVVIDIDNKSLTHRPDLWGHFGIAREMSALFQVPLKNRFDDDWMNNLKSKVPGGASPVKVRFAGESAGLAYLGLSVDGVKVGPSPDWMQARLQAAGLRSLNNIVDISNYVMLELGIPLHLFDRDQIQGGEVVIERVTGPQKFTTLDEVERELVSGDTVISDKTGPLVLAGIMGGLKSGVNENTTKLFIEVANWRAPEVRRTSTRLGLRTDSSQRYEKTLDSQLLMRTLWRTLELILEFCPGAKVQGSLELQQSAGTSLSEFKPLQISLPLSRVHSVLGTPMARSEVVRILTALDFKVETEKSFLVSVPSYRSTKDIENEADLIEELGRVIGYDSIPPLSPKLDVAPVELSPAHKLHQKIRDFMVFHAHSFELMSYPLIGEKLLKKASWPATSGLELMNSLSVDHNQMRPSLIPGLLEIAALNAKSFSEFDLFELGRVYNSDAKKFANEETHLVLASFQKDSSSFMKLLNTMERLLQTLNAPADFAPAHPKFKNSVVPEEWTGLHPHEFLNIRLMGKMSGAVFTVHPLVMRSFKMKGHLSFAVLNLAPLEERPPKEKTSYTPLPKFPGSSFDWTVQAHHDVSVTALFDALKTVKLKELQSVKIVDEFHLNDEFKTITLRARFLDPEKTLSGEFLQSAQQALVDTLQKAGFPLKS